MITVGNGYVDGWNSGHYIGRAGKGKAGSALANPYRLNNPNDDVERSHVIAQYRKWLWQKIQSGDSAVMAELNQLKQQALVGDVHLLCFCKPRNCHGLVIANCINWLIEQEK